MTNLDPDLQRILNVNAKVYNTQTKRQGKVTSVTPELITVDYGSKYKPDTQEYDIEDFSQMLIDDVIVANHRLTTDDRERFIIKPRVKAAQTVNMTQDVKVQAEPGLGLVKVDNPKFYKPAVEINQPAEIGYINFTTGKYSTEPKKGYTKVEFRKCLEKVTLELTSEEIDKLRELGIVK